MKVESWKLEEVGTLGEYLRGEEAPSRGVSVLRIPCFSQALPRVWLPRFRTFIIIICRCLPYYLLLSGFPPRLASLKVGRCMELEIGPFNTPT